MIDFSAELIRWGNTTMKKQILAIAFAVLLGLTAKVQAQQWNLQYTPPGGGDIVSAVDFWDANNGLAVGHGVSDNYTVYRYVGGTWTQQLVPQVIDGQYLSTVKFTSATTAWAGGDEGVILKYSNGNWSVVQTPDAVYGPYLYSFHFTDPNNGWAVGYGTAYGSGLIIKFHNGVWDIPGGSWQTWYNSPHPSYIPATGISHILNSVDFAGANDGWAVGNGGIMLKYNANTDKWVQQPSITTQGLLKVRLLDANTGWAVGSQGTVLKFSAGVWSVASPVAAIGTDFLGSADFVDASHGWAASPITGTIYRYANGAWSAQTDPAQTAPAVERLRDIHFVDANHGWAVGHNLIIWTHMGTLKVCKVAGPGVVPGTPFTFTAGSAPPFSVAAGPPPGGTCSIGPSFDEGTPITLTESLTGATTVTDIAVAPPARLAGPPNLATGSVNLTIGSGVTEATFTNRRPTGFLEICKKVVSSYPPLSGGTFSFTLNPGNMGPIQVPAGSCSPAIEVPVGQVTIREALSPQIQLLSCTAVPTANQGPCNLAAGTFRVTVVQGDVSTQTIATLTNKVSQIRVLDGAGNSDTPVKP